MSDTNLEKRISMMDNAFSDYLMKKLSDDSLERKLSTILTSLDFDSGDKEFEVCIVKNNGKEPFFGMRVFPVIEEANKQLVLLFGEEIKNYASPTFYRNEMLTIAFLSSAIFS